MKQAELIKNMSDDMVRKQLLLSQSIFFILSILLSVFLFPHFDDWLLILTVDMKQILLVGIVPAIIIVIIEIMLYVVFPSSYFDDGGVNEKVFKNQTVGNIFLISIVVAVSEEFLFRGVIQTAFGYLFASTLFALIHIRYLKKPVLLILVFIISFLLGYLFKITENLLVVIAFHFTIDFLLGLYIKYKL